MGGYIRNRASIRGCFCAGNGRHKTGFSACNSIDEGSARPCAAGLKKPRGIDLGRLLVTLATFLVLLLAAASVAPALMDWKAYRPDIEQAASALLGRKISIIGEIDIALLPEPHLH